MKKYIFSVMIFLLFPGCQNTQDNSQAAQSIDTPAPIICDLNDSTEIIMQLLKENNLKTILLEADSSNSELMLKNFSPSEMALQAEALNQPGISVLIFYKKNNDWDIIYKKLLESAQKYPEIKFVKIDADVLFRVTQNAYIESFPALIFIKDKEEIDRLEPVSLDTIQEDIDTIIKKITR